MAAIVALIAAPACQRATDRGAVTPAEVELPTLAASPAPPGVFVPDPWWLSLELDEVRGGIRITSMDVRTFAAPLLQPGDVVLAIHGRPVRLPDELRDDLLAVPPGQLVLLTVLRDDRTIDYVLLHVPDGDEGS